jgi:xanthine dehydrogenase accessory factor
MFDLLDRLLEFRQKQTPVAMATIIQSDGHTPRKVGSKMLITSAGPGETEGTIGGGSLEMAVIQEAVQCLQHGAHKIVRFPLQELGQICGGYIEVFIECHNLGPQLYLLGGGHVGLACAQVLQGTPFHTHLVDDRPDWISTLKIPPGTTTHCGPWQDFIDSFHGETQKTYLAIFTYTHELDYWLLCQLLRKNFRYLGLIGSAKKWQETQARLLSDGFTPEEIKKITCPIGHKTGNAPAEVAIALAQQILEIYYP